MPCRCIYSYKKANICLFTTKLIYACLYSDLLRVASVNADKSSFTESTRVTLQCFCESFNAILDDPSHLGDLPQSIKPVDGTGVLINLTGKTRWQPFATWMIKLIGKCLTEGTLYVDGLINMPFFMAAGSLFCYGDADLHMVSCNYFFIYYFTA